MFLMHTHAHKSKRLFGHRNDQLNTIIRAVGFSVKDAVVLLVQPFANSVREDKVVEVLTLHTYEGGVYLLQRDSSQLLSVERFEY